MEKILKNINLYDILNHRLNPNLKVWEITDDTCTVIQNITGSGAFGVPVIENGILTEIEIICQGSGYSSNTSIFIDGGDGYGAVATPVITGGKITGAIIESGGSGYNNPPKITFNDILTKSIAANVKINITRPFNPYGKTIYTDNTYRIETESVILSPYDCDILYNDLHTFQETANYITTVCTANVNDTRNVNISQFIDSVENWYYKEGDRLYPYLYFLLTDNFEENFEVTCIHVSDGGYDYSENPKVIISTPVIGEQATAKATVTGGEITAINITTPGNGYTTPPVVTVTDTPGRGAKAETATGNPTFTFQPLMYYKPKNIAVKVSFLDYVFAGSTIGIDILKKPFNRVLSLQNIINDTNERHDFICNYILTEGKIIQISDLIYTRLINDTHIQSAINTISEYDIYSDIKNQVYNFVYEKARVFFREQFPTNVTTVTHEFNPGTYVFEETDPPKIKLPIILENTGDDIGIFSSPIKEWVPGKRYRLNDSVIYDGKVYILKVVNNEGYFAGIFNYIDNNIYFDHFNFFIGDENKNTETASDMGHFSHFLTDNVGQLKHWKLTVTETADKHTIDSNSESMLYTLKGLISVDKNRNFFDVEGKYRENVYHNYREITVTPTTTVYYRSYIKNISDIKYYDENNRPVENASDTNYTEYEDIVRREIVYQYVINEIATNTTNPVTTTPRPSTGIDFIDTITSNLINGAKDEWDTPVITTVSKHRIYSFQDPKYRMDDDINEDTIDGTTGVNYHDMNSDGNNMIYTSIAQHDNNMFYKYEHLNNEIWAYSPLIKEEYLFGINGGEPKVEDNINIERGIIYSQDKHMALGEIKTFEQALSYNNGSFWKIYDNTKKPEQDATSSLSMSDLENMTDALTGEVHALREAERTAKEEGTYAET
jgi:hypothetical protein